MSDHPSVLAAVDAVIARELPYHPGVDNSTTRELYAAKSATALAAGFRERAGFTETWCVHNPPTVLGHLLCGKCAWLADMLRNWADEIEASAGPTEEISNA